jgi:hypothetical protein
MMLTYRQLSGDPPSCRVLFDGVEIGSVSLQMRHTKGNALFWHWGVDIMPRMDHGGRPPSGEIGVEDGNVEAGFHDALAEFKRAFTAWHAGLDPELWYENLEHKREGQERIRRYDKR